MIRNESYKVGGFYILQSKEINLISHVYFNVRLRVKVINVEKETRERAGTRGMVPGNRTSDFRVFAFDALRVSFRFSTRVAYRCLSPRPARRKIQRRVLSQEELSQRLNAPQNLFSRKVGCEQRRVRSLFLSTLPPSLSRSLGESFCAK